jgi:periplasmic protein CpxP/Spy
MKSGCTEIFFPYQCDQKNSRSVKERTRMNLSRTKKVVGVVALAIVLVTTAVIGFAQEGRRGGGGHRGGFGHAFRSLDLTEAQQSQLRQIMERNRQSTASLREQLKANRGAGRDMLSTGAFDEQAVRSAAQTRAAAQVELEVARARMLSEMYAVLTPEQKAQLAEKRRQREQRRQERKQRRDSQQGGTSPTTEQ